MEGYTLALDFPVNAATMRLLERFDAIVAAHGGRLYLAKDARMGRRAYGRLSAAAEFRAVRQRYGLEERFRSAQSVRLGRDQGAVLVLGARSDIGRAIARRYAAGGRAWSGRTAGGDAGGGLGGFPSALPGPGCVAEFDVTSGEPDRFFAALASPRGR